ncbi:MAG: hypothetical protein Q8R28_12300 [Dehalococcoidia bacterium]|nr:hypothetical protein [Dehalococcoidia bacterium]
MARFGLYVGQNVSQTRQIGLFAALNVMHVPPPGSFTGHLPGL